MVETATAEFPGVPVRAVVGGYHLAKLPPFRSMSESELAIAERRALLSLQGSNQNPQFFTLPGNARAHSTNHAAVSMSMRDEFWVARHMAVPHITVHRRLDRS